MGDSATTSATATVDDYLATLDPGRRADCDALIRIGRDVTGEPPTMSGRSIVGFGRSHYRYDSGREGEAALFSFAPRAKAFTLYLSSGGIEPFQPILDRLGKYRTGTGCLYVNRLADVDEAVLAELVRATVADTRARYPATPNH